MLAHAFELLIVVNEDKSTDVIPEQFVNIPEQALVPLIVVNELKLTDVIPAQLPNILEHALSPLMVVNELKSIVPYKTELGVNL